MGSEKRNNFFTIRIDHCGLHKLREILEFFFFFLFSFNRQFFLKVKLC